MYKWYSLLNTKVTNTDTQYLSRVLILIYSMLSINLNNNIYLHSYTYHSLIPSFLFKFVVQFFILIIVVDVFFCILLLSLYFKHYDSNLLFSYDIAFSACVFCISMVNVDCYEGAFQLPLIIVIAVSITVSLLSMLMLHRLPQAIENLAFRVRKYSIKY